MLKSMTKGACVLAAAAAFSATSAQADEHSVLIMDGGFFPAVSYVKPGDFVVFTNNSEETITLAGTDQSWLSDAIAVDETHTLHVTGALSLDFVAVAMDSAVAGDEGEEDQDYINLDDVLMEGAFSFDDAPLDSDSTG